MILIIGAGDVGSNIATDLADSHDVTVIDVDSGRIEALTSGTDVSGVVGDGRSVSTLREAGIERAEMVIASTDSDAANVMACNAAKQVGDPYTIARVKEVGLYRTWQSLDGTLGVDTMLCIDLLAAENLARTVALPGARTSDTLADGQVEVAEFTIREDTPMANQTIAEADRYASTTFAAIVRDDDVLIPTGDTVVRPGDRVVVIGSLSNVTGFAKDVATDPTLDPDADIAIVGGGVLGYQLAQQFEARGWTPNVLERDSDRATQLTTRLRGSSVTEVDVTSIGGYDPDVLTGADLVVGTVDDDTNYLLTQLTRERDVGRTAAVVDDPELVEMFEETGIEVVVHPQDIIAGEILSEIYGGEDVKVFDHDRAEILEVVVDEESALSGTTLEDAADRIPGEFVVGAIIRNGQLQLPRGNKLIQVGDHVIVFTDAEAASEVADSI